MRLWSISPEYLDQKGLVALWRESLLAKAVLEGKTKGYKNHPQLVRFKESSDPIAAINKYLKIIFSEASKRDYSFDKSKIDLTGFNEKLTVTNGQLEYEFRHLMNKLEIRDPKLYRSIKALKTDEIRPNPLFNVTKGEISHWERV